MPCDLVKAVPALDLECIPDGRRLGAMAAVALIVSLAGLRNQALCCRKTKVFLMI